MFFLTECPTRSLKIVFLVYCDWLCVLIELSCVLVVKLHFAEDCVIYGYHGIEFSCDGLSVFFFSCLLLIIRRS